MREFCGRPLIWRTLYEALLCPSIAKIVVSTDDASVAAYCRMYRCDVVERDAQLATDEASSAEVVLDVLRRYPGYERFVLLQPTSPLRVAADIEAGLALGPCVSVGGDGRPNGAVYVGDTAYFRAHPYFGGAVLYMPDSRSIDVNNGNDLRLAEEKMLDRMGLPGQAPRCYADGHVEWRVP